jgi:hypothetical protein
MFIPTTTLTQGASGIGALLFDSTLGGDAASIDTGAAGIAGGYDVLMAWMLTRTTEAAVASTLNVTLNADGGANYDYLGSGTNNNTFTGSTQVAQTQWVFGSFGASAETGACTVTQVQIPAYTQTNFHKSAIVLQTQTEDTAADARNRQYAARWRSTAAVTRMAVAAGSGNLLAGSRLLIYGI